MRLQTVEMYVVSDSNYGFEDITSTPTVINSQAINIVPPTNGAPLSPDVILD